MENESRQRQDTATAVYFSIIFIYLWKSHHFLQNFAAISAPWRRKYTMPAESRQSCCKVVYVVIATVTRLRLHLFCRS